MAQGRFWLGEERDVMNVIRWFESRFELLDGHSDMPAVRSIFARGFGDEEASFSLPDDFAPKSANEAEPPNFVLPNEDEAEPDGQLLHGPIKSYNYFAKPLDSGDVVGEPVGLAIFGLFGVPGFNAKAFGADSVVPDGIGLADGPPADLLGAPPVI